MSRAKVTLDLRSRAGLFAHLEAMERAGVPIDRALASLNLGGRHEAAVKRLRQMVGNGRDLASSGQLSGVFTPLESSLIRAAQEAGALTHIYRQLAQRYDEQARHVTELRSRLLLPAGVLLLALSLYTGAFIAEIVRAGILAVSRGQSEAAAALGLQPRCVLP